MRGSPQVDKSSGVEIAHPLRRERSPESAGRRARLSGAELLSGLAAAPPADLHEQLIVPLPIRVIASPGKRGALPPPATRRADS